MNPNPNLPDPPADRRAFLRGAAGVAALSATNYGRVVGANERIGVGVIGYGLIARTHVATFTKVDGAEVVAVADCHAKRAAEGAAAAGKKATAYTDFRKLLDDRAVGAVVVATPDHWHALLTMLACDAGKDVYVEKPLTLFAAEGEWIQHVAKRTRRVVQVGTQQRSGPHYLKARELIRSGHLGKVTAVRITAVRNVSPGFGNPADGPVPEGFDYDRWLGPAPARAYNPNRGLYHFRWFWDYSGGQMTNLAAHQLDIIDWSLGLDQLTTVASVGGRLALTDNGEVPDTQDAIFDCGGFTVSFTLREAARGEPSSSLVFHGTRGSMAVDRGGFQVTPDLDTPAVNQIPGVKSGHPAGGPVAVAHENPKPRTEAVTDTTGDAGAQYLAHAANFLDCIRTRATPASDVASADRTAVACHLANLSLRLRRSLRWDAASRSVVGDKEATALLTRPYRAPWDRELAALLKGEDK